MNHWAENSRRNLLSFSKNKDDFRAAIEEWEHTGVVIDHGDTVQVCELCEHPQLRYHYEVVNKHTDQSLMVGSDCIEKFEIAVFDEQGNRLTGEAVSQQLRKEIEHKQMEMRLEPLRALWLQAESLRFTIKSFADCLKERGSLSPDQLLLLFREMKERNISYPSYLYQASLRSNAEKSTLASMSPQDIELIWPSLSPAQRERFERERDNWQRQVAKKQERPTPPTEEQERLISPIQKLAQKSAHYNSDSSMHSRKEKQAETFVEYKGQRGYWITLPSGNKAFIASSRSRS